MRILIDTNILILLLDARENIRAIDEGGTVLNDAKARREKFFDYIEGKAICISTITLAEFLQKIDDDKKAKYIDTIKNLVRFEILPFDEISAYELAKLPEFKQWKFLAKNINRSSLTLKLDRQIVAIAIANQVDELWTNDDGMLSLLNICRQSKICNVSPKSLKDISLEGTIEDFFE